MMVRWAVERWEASSQASKATFVIKRNCGVPLSSGVRA